MLKNWSFWIVVLEKTLESPLDCKEIKPVNHKGNQSWVLIGRTDAEAEALILWPPDVKNRLIVKDPDAGKDWRQEEKGMTEDEMVGWHHWLNGHEFEQALGDGEGQGSIPWAVHGVAKSQTQLGDWTELRVKNLSMVPELLRDRDFKFHTLPVVRHRTFFLMFFGNFWVYGIFRKPEIISDRIQNGLDKRVLTDWLNLFQPVSCWAWIWVRVLSFTYFSIMLVWNTARLVQSLI